MNSLLEEERFVNNLQQRITQFFKKFAIGSAFRASNGAKAKGVSATLILMTLIQQVFTHKSLWRSHADGTAIGGFGIDTTYRFLRNSSINWTMFVLRVAAKVVFFLKSLTSEKRLDALVIDDSMFERPRSKKVELLAKVFDHAEKTTAKYKRGFRMLTIAWTDGASLVPLLFRHMSSQEKKNRYVEAKSDLNKRSIAYKIRLQAVSPTVDVMLEMLRMVKKVGITTKHVLFDSWFAEPTTIMRVVRMGFHVVGRLKNSRTKYNVGGESKTLSQIYRSNRKRPGRSKYLLCVRAEMHDKNRETMEAQIVFVRDRSNTKKWIAFVSTDLSLDANDVIAMYGKRWDIEVFFKVTKSYLKLIGEFQQMTYDAITAHTAIVFIRYMLIAYEKRVSEDWRTCGEVFFLLCDEVADVTFEGVMEIILAALRDALTENLSLTKEQIGAIIDAFIGKLSRDFRFEKGRDCA